MLEIDSSKKNLKAEKEIIRNSPQIFHQSEVYQTSDDRVPFVPTGTIYLEFIDDVDKQTKEDLLKALGLKIVEQEKDGALTVAISVGSLGAIDACLKLQAETIVKIAEPDLATYGELKQFSVPNDRFFPRLWHLKNAGQIEGETVGLVEGADARVVEAWQLLEGFGSREVVIGIIDDGFDLGHPDLAENAVHAWDFQNNSADVTPVGNRASPTNGDWHGTAVAGIAIGAVGKGSIVGVAPGCSWIPVGWNPKLDPLHVAKWFEYLERKGAWVANCSWSALARNYPLPTRLHKAINSCVFNSRNRKGCTILFAAGNEGRDINDQANQSVNGFASHPDVVAIAASTSLDKHAEYSNFGAKIDVCAPSSGDGGRSGAGGRNISTADVRGTFTDIINVVRPLGYSDTDYNHFFGRTSGACPIAAGICALMLSANPFLSPTEIREILRKSSRKIGPEESYDAKGHSDIFGYGCVNAGLAVEMAMEQIRST